MNEPQASPSPTPETDAHTEYYADYGMDFVPTEFARRLERQRDALVKKVKIVANSVEFVLPALPIKQRAGMQAIADELRAALAQVKKS